MSLYLDTSVLVTALTPERDTVYAQSWLAENQDAPLHISAWVAAEFSSALSAKLRGGSLRPQDRSGALAIFAGQRRDVFESVSISASAFELAIRFTDRLELGVRASDALHLAIAAEHGLTLVTLDRRQAEAGPPLGIPTQLL